MKDAKSCKVSPNITSVLSSSKPGFFSAYLSHKQCCVHYLLALEAVDILDPFLIKAAQPENLFSLEVFLLYFSQPQKVLNRVTFSQSKGAVGHNKERTN